MYAMQMLEMHFGILYIRNGFFHLLFIINSDE